MSAALDVDGVSGMGSAKGRSLAGARLLAPFEVLRERGGGSGSGIFPDALRKDANGDFVPAEILDDGDRTLDDNDVAEGNLECCCKISL